MLNKVILMGRLTRAPELRCTVVGKNVCNFSIAINSGYGDNQTTDYINCIAWEKTAEFVSKYFDKGKMITVVGRLRTESWKDNDGKTHYATKVIANEVAFGESKETETSPQTPAENAGFVTVTAEDLPWKQ